MAEILLSAAADADLHGVLAHGEENFGWPAAEAYYDSFEEAFDLLKRHPRIGPEAFPGSSAIRVLRHRRHRLFYEVRGNEILIIRILHHAMDAGRRLG